MTAYMVDLYPDGPLERLSYVPGGSLFQACPLFDGTGYETRENGERFGWLSGGPLRRLFGVTRSLQKTPFFWHSVLFAHASIHQPMARRYQPRPEAAVLHFKLLNDFRERVSAAVSSGQYFKGSAHYAAIQQVLSRMPSIDFRYEGSRRYEGPESLTDAGLLRRFPW